MYYFIVNIFFSLIVSACTNSLLREIYCLPNVEDGAHSFLPLLLLLDAEQGQENILLMSPKVAGLQVNLDNCELFWGTGLLL